MTFTSYPFDNQDTTEAQYSALFRELQNSGVVDGFGGTGLQVSANSSALAVTMQPGAAIVRGFFFNNDAVWTQAVNAPGAAIRYDAIILRLDPAANSIVPVYVPNAGLTPVLTQTTTGIYEILLALVTVNPSAVTIGATDVTDKRHFARGRIGVWNSTNRPATPRAYDVGINPDRGGRFEIYDPIAGWVNRLPIYWGAGTAFPASTTLLVDGDTFRRTDLGSIWQWDGSKWDIVSGKLPVYRVIRNTSGAFNSSTQFVPVPYNAVDAATTNNPDGLFFGNTLDGSVDRRVQVKRDGLYLMEAECYGNVFPLGMRIGYMSSATVMGTPIANMNASTVSAVWRLAANDYVGVSVILNGSDAPDGTNGYRNHFKLTRLSA